MLYFIDQTSEKEHHLMFNVAMLQVLQELYPHQKIMYQGIVSNQEAVLAQLPLSAQQHIVLDPIVYTKPKGSSLFFRTFNFLKKERLRYTLLQKVLKQTTATDVIFFSITTFSTFLVFKWLKKNHPVTTLMVLHGDLDFVYNAGSLVEKSIGFSYKIMFNLKAPNFYYLLLNKIAAPFLIRDKHLLPEEILAIHHPYPQIDERHFNRKTLQSPLVLGHIGSAEVKRKNSHLLYQLATSFEDAIATGQLQFQLIGLNAVDMAPYRSNLVEEVTGNTTAHQPTYLSRASYEAAVSQLHYAVFFYAEQHYIFRASGAVIDALAFEIPILALRHPFFEALFNEGGTIGYLFDSVTAMANFIATLRQNPAAYEATYQQQKINLHKLKQKYKVDYIAADLARQINSK